LDGIHKSAQKRHTWFEILPVRGKLASQFFHFASMASPLQRLGSRLKAGLGTTLVASSGCAMGFAFFSAPASAALTGCAQGDTSGQFLYSDISSNPGFTCYVGDKLYSNFSNFSGLAANDTFSLFQGGPNDSIHSLSVQGGSNGGYFTPGTYGFDYKVTVWQGNQAIQNYSTGATTNIPGVTWQKDLISTGTPNSATATNNSLGGTSQFSTFNPPLTAADFTTQLTVGAGVGVTQWTDALVQTPNNPPSASVPAPLPLLGASAAFGLSRRLRRRVRQAA
jgi:hypothetical protein